jgi:hypothetical protein
VVNASRRPDSDNNNNIKHYASAPRTATSYAPRHELLQLHVVQVIVVILLEIIIIITFINLSPQQCIKNEQ